VKLQGTMPFRPLLPRHADVLALAAFCRCEGLVIDNRERFREE